MRTLECARIGNFVRQSSVGYIDYVSGSFHAVGIQIRSGR